MSCLRNGSLRTLEILITGAVRDQTVLFEVCQSLTGLSRFLASHGIKVNCHYSGPDFNQFVTALNSHIFVEDCSASVNEYLQDLRHLSGDNSAHIQAAQMLSASKFLPSAFCLLRLRTDTILLPTAYKVVAQWCLGDVSVLVLPILSRKGRLAYRDWIFGVKSKREAFCFWRKSAENLGQVHFGYYFISSIVHSWGALREEIQATYIKTLNDPKKIQGELPFKDYLNLQTSILDLTSVEFFCSSGSSSGLIKNRNLRKFKAVRKCMPISWAYYLSGFSTRC